MGRAPLTAMSVLASVREADLNVDRLGEERACGIASELHQEVVQAVGTKRQRSRTSGNVGVMEAFEVENNRIYGWPGPGWLRSW